jgi:hypothetical protein
MSTLNLVLLDLFALIGGIRFLFAIPPVGFAGAAVVSASGPAVKPAITRFITTVLDMGTAAALLCVCVCVLSAPGS